MHSSSLLILIPLVSFLLYCVLLAVLLGSRMNKIAKYYAYYIVSMIIWSFGSFVMKTGLGPSTLFWNRILCIGLISVPIVFYHFSLALTNRSNQDRKLQLGYLFAFIMLMCNFKGLIVAEAYMLNNTFKYTLGPAAPVMAIWSLCYLILSFMNIYGSVRSNQIPYIRVKFIMMGLGIEIAGALLNLFPTIGQYPVDIISNTINGILIAYAIYKYKFLEIKLIARKGLAYSLYTLLLTGIYIIAIFVMQQLVSSIIGYSNTTHTLIMAVLLAIILQPIKNVIQHWIDQVFYKQRLNHQDLLKQFSQIINNVLDLDELTNSMVNVLKQGIQPKSISIILKQGNEDFCLARITNRELQTQEVQYNSKHPIVQWLSQDKQMLTMDEIDILPYFSGLWNSEKMQLRELDAELIMPIKYSGQLTGLLVLAEKRSGEAYSKEELDFVTTLMNNAAVVIENAKLYENIRQQAITDGLTKLYNHRHFHEVLNEFVQGKHGSLFSLAILDVDLFKFYNDLYGHSAGDKVISKIAEILKATTDKEAIIARYGGEEFAVIFPGIEGKESFKAIEDIRYAVEEAFAAGTDSNVFLTISAGVANYPRDGKNAEELIENADKAMYAAKQSGRNKCILYSEYAAKGDKNSHGNEILDLQDSVKAAYFSAIYALAATIDAKDQYTYGHSENVAKYAVALAQAAGLEEERIDTLKHAGLLHDIGKIGIPENILTKTEPLTQEEYTTMQRHVDISVSIIKHVPGLLKVIPAIMSHHERYDGKGYPRGIKGENIPIEGRCLCIVDAFDAMTTDRPYRKALEVEEALLELKKHSGTQFDPLLTELFIKLFNNIEMEAV